MHLPIDKGLSRQSRAAKAEAHEASEGVPRIDGKDLRDALTLAVLSPFAFSLPESAMAGIAGTLAPLLVPRKSPGPQVVRLQRSVLGDGITDTELARINRGWVEENILDRLYLLRCYGLGGWQPHIEVEGLAHLEAGLAGGRGVLLWATPFRFNDLVTKMAFARAGQPYEQLSRFSHPGSRTAFGCAYLNPIRVNVENKYLARRLVIGRDKRVEGLPTLDALADRLKANRTVTITVGQNGRHTVTVPLLRGQVRLATGPCHLALRTGAPVLPVFTIRTGRNRFKVSVGKALEPGPRASTSERIEAMICDYTARLGPVLRKWPHQFPWNRFDAGQGGL